MKSLNHALWGLVIIAVGVCLLLRELNLFNVDIFFDGWWTLFIIVPCAISLVTNDNKVISLLGISIGVLLLLGEQDVLERSMAHHLIVPVVLIFVGLHCLCKGVFSKEQKFCSVNVDVHSDNFNHTQYEGMKDYSVIFSGQDVNACNQVFTGANIKAAFGGFTLDLRGAIIESDVTVNVQCAFGGVEIYIPNDVNVLTTGDNVFGGVDIRNHRNPGNGHKTIYINTKCFFGGVNVNGTK